MVKNRFLNLISIYHTVALNITMCIFGYIMALSLTVKCEQHHEKLEYKNVIGPEP